MSSVDVGVAEAARSRSATVLSSDAVSESWTAKLADFRELSKPRIAMMGLVTVSVGYVVAGGDWSSWQLTSTLFGVGLVAVACAALNQWMERDTDALMSRTAERPLPSGRLHPTAALIYGLTAGVIGLVWLAVMINPLTAILSAATLVLYVGCYTPLKRQNAICTIVGAIPGALPPILGWAAAQGGLSTGAWVLFGILFLWQFPHFLAIGWLYHSQYSAAGLKMIPERFLKYELTGWVSVGYSLALIPISLLIVENNLAGQVYTWMALGLGAIYLVCAVLFAMNENRKNARRLLWGSLLYLPLLLAALTADYLWLYG
ncbi:heme o synthase [Calycomorphotria hydatis]|uniref:Protoheme IX farnesyltransferase n=1 Tax=Calycomorphotria hydatis TaxID=2528027 RepID=A0A517TCP8_9PLAN|nr:heme o synthase [Calycomorphotria hydatis]QDT66146.1 Protoheme IX farnesyltransferase 1 [Calycomorphotria hydatis]